MIFKLRLILHWVNRNSVVSLLALPLLHTIYTCCSFFRDSEPVLWLHRQHDERSLLFTQRVWCEASRAPLKPISFDILTLPLDFVPIKASMHGSSQEWTTKIRIEELTLLKRSGYEDHSSIIKENILRYLLTHYNALRGFNFDT